MRSNPDCTRATPAPTSSDPRATSSSERCTTGCSTLCREPQSDCLHRSREDGVVELVEPQLVLERRAQDAARDQLTAGAREAPGDDACRRLRVRRRRGSSCSPRPRSRRRAARLSSRASSRGAPRRPAMPRMPPKAVRKVSTPRAAASRAALRRARARRRDPRHPRRSARARAWTAHRGTPSSRAASSRDR